MQSNSRPIHFEDYSGEQFERICFAYLLRIKVWESLEWYGQSGSDGGRDIWGITLNKNQLEEKHCIQCSNRGRTTFTKVENDLAKLKARSNGIPDHYTVFAGGKIGAKTRDKIKAECISLGINSQSIFSGPEFEELLRKNTPDLLQRFVAGDLFPDSPQDLAILEQDSSESNDNQALSIYSRAFDRPAFLTQFRFESNLPDFKKAITDTIELLNTGIYRLRDGTEIARTKSKHSFLDKDTQAVLEQVTDRLVSLRTAFDELIASGEIRPGAISEPQFAEYLLSEKASKEMDGLRKSIFTQLQKIIPDIKTPKY